MDYQNSISRIEIYLRERISAPDNIDIPDSYGYIHYKAYSYLKIGPDAYRKQDALGMPLNDTSPAKLEILKIGCHQICEWKGITQETSLQGLGISGFYELLKLFHFKPLTQQAINKQYGKIIDKIIFRHLITEKEITLFNLLLI